MKEQFHNDQPIRRSYLPSVNDNNLDPFDYLVKKTMLEADHSEMKNRKTRLQKLNALCQ